MARNKHLAEVPVRATVEPPPLAMYRQISDYVPSHGDFIVWSGWITTWHCVVAEIDSDLQSVGIICANMPLSLFTMSDSEQQREIKYVELSKIRKSTPGSFAAMHHDRKQNAVIWYI
jgi:hypothetical protein